MNNKKNRFYTFYLHGIKDYQNKKTSFYATISIKKQENY